MSQKYLRGEPPLKRLKRDDDDNSGLNEDALSIVLEFLAPKELLSLAFTSKALASKISVRLVVRSALMHGEYAGRTIRALYTLMKRKAIYVPSPLRLLRLVNGKRCECCLEQKVNFVRHQGFGVLFCWDCTKESTTKLNTATNRVQQNPRYAELLKHPRVIMEHFNGGRKYYCWSRQFVHNGEICGPLVTYEDIQTTASSTSTHVDNIVSHAPPESAYEEFVEAYEGSTTAAAARQRERGEKKKIARETIVQKRKENVLRMIGLIRELLDSSWSDFALDYTEEDQRGWRGWSAKPCVRLNITFCNEVLEPYVFSPSKAKTKSVISRLAAGINTRFRTIESFLDFSFLSDFEPFEVRLKQYCQELYPNLTTFLQSNDIDGDCYAQIAGREPFQALMRMLGPELSDGVLLLPLSVASPPAHVQLACLVWRAEWSKRLGRYYKRLQTLRETYITVFSESRTAFLLYTERAEEYISWLHSQDYVLDLFVTYAESDTLREPLSLQFLLKKDFSGLLAFQERSWRSFPV